VNVLTSKSKEKQGRWRRRTRVLGRTSAWRKAVVTLKAGDKIEIFEGV
jgi:large subunit ribosomal protein L23